MTLAWFEVSEDPAKVVEHHLMDADLGVAGLTKLSLMALLSAAVVFVLVRLAARGKGLVPKGFVENTFESVVLFVRDELVRPVMGHHGDKLVPYFCTVFTFILVTNLLGMVPYLGGAATGNMGMTLVLAAGTLITGVVMGVKENGLGVFLHAFIPPGLPLILRPILFLLELLGFLIKHLVLALRLCINMTAGHLVLGAFISMIFATKSYVAAGPAVGLAVFMNVLEILVCFIQAYVFTLLSVLFVGSLVHPEH